MDATIIAAPSSTKNQAQARDPEMKQTRKGKNWHFGMKLHIGTDRRGTVHRLTATHAAASDIGQLPELLHGEESVVYGDQAYWKEADRQDFEERGVRYRVNRRAPGGNRNLSEYWPPDQPCAIADARPVRASPSGWSNACGASTRRVTAGSARTWPVPRRCLRWPTCTPCATACYRPEARCVL